MARIEVEVKVHLPHDENGVSAQPGQVITVDTDNPYIRGYLETGLLYPLTPLEFSLDLKPPVPPAQDAADDAAADAGTTVGPIPDAPQHAAQAPAGEVDNRGLLAPYEPNTRDTLYAEVQRRGLTGLSDATKAELVDALLDDDTERERG